MLIYQVETYENQDYQEFIVCHMDCCVLTLVFCWPFTLSMFVVPEIQLLRVLK